MAPPPPPPSGGVSVPLRAAFTVWRAVPWFAVASNNAGPRLVLHPDAVEARVLRARHAPYDAIAEADGVVRLGRALLTLTWTDGLFAFRATLRDRADLAPTLRALAARGVPLTDRARRLADAS